MTVVSDDVALIAAIYEAMASRPDPLEKIREGKVQAAGAVIGHEGDGGSAHARRPRQLVSERAQG